MKVIYPITGPILNIVQVWTVREVDDPRASMPFTICVRRLDGTLVASRNIVHDVDFDPDVKHHFISITGQPPGIYMVETWNGFDCNIPSDRVVFRTYVHRTDDLTFVHMGWSPSRWSVFWLYVHGGRLFYGSVTHVNYAVVPRNIDTFVEMTGNDGKVFVGMVKTNDEITVSPNGTYPFRAVITLKADRPIADKLALSLDYQFRRGMAVRPVALDTVVVEIVKNHVGAVPLVAAAILLGLGAVIAITAAVITYFNAQVEFGRQRIITSLIEERRRLIESYLSEYDTCKGDTTCIWAINRKYIPIIESTSQIIGEVAGVECDGLQIGGACVPWWIVGIAVLIAGLMVVAVLR